ncbi:hypothetical protein T439DRAFT_357464 [Meredithblackwellia eburnea MCA 4105]
MSDERHPSVPLKTPSSWTLLSSHNHFFPSHWRWEPNHETYHDHKHGVKLDWNSRSQRKGIPAEVVKEKPRENEEVESGDSESDVNNAAVSAGGEKWKVKRGSIRWVGFDWWDISWWVAIIFVVGSIFWCVNGILAFCFFTNTTLPYTNTEAATAFLGGFTFIVGAYLGWVESMNPARDADFGWEVDETMKILFEPKQTRRGHSLGRKRHHLGKHHPSPPSPTSSNLESLTKPNTDQGLPVAVPPPPPLTSVPSSESATLHSPSNGGRQATSSPPPEWKWFGTYRSLAYVANTIQLFGASIFFVSVLCGLPGILPLSGGSGGPEQEGKSEGLWVGLYWACQVIGAPCFVIAGAMFCIEVQNKWWLPAPLKLGWQIGFWNLIGGFGFWFCGIFGIWRQTSIQDPTLYQKWGTAFSTFWGSWAFLIGSYLQLWEGINKRT